MVEDIKSQKREELEARFTAWGQPAYRASQLLDWLYVQRVTNWEMMTNLPKQLRENLVIERLRVVAMVLLQNVLDALRMRDHTNMNVEHPNVKNVAVLT